MPAISRARRSCFPQCSSRNYEGPADNDNSLVFRWMWLSVCVCTCYPIDGTGRKVAFTMRIPIVSGDVVVIANAPRGGSSRALSLRVPSTTRWIQTKSDAIGWVRVRKKIMDHGTDREPKKQRNEDHERETNSALTRTVRKECSWGFGAVTLICSLRAPSNIIPSRFHHLRVNYRGGIYTE